MINHVRDVSGLPVGFKSVVGAYGWIEELCQLIHARGIESAPDFITIDSGDGGTGAAPMSLMDCVGLPIRESLPLVVNILTEHGLRDRIKIIASGKLITPAEAAAALCIGADFIQSARGFMFSLGCIQALQCNKNTCPTGIATHDPGLTERARGHGQGRTRLPVLEEHAQRDRHHCAFLWRQGTTSAEALSLPRRTGRRAVDPAE